MNKALHVDENRSVPPTKSPGDKELTSLIMDMENKHGKALFRGFYVRYIVYEILCCVDVFQYVLRVGNRHGDIMPSMDGEEISQFTEID